LLGYYKQLQGYNIHVRYENLIANLGTGLGSNFSSHKLTSRHKMAPLRLSVLAA
jgi:hypothetical protein